MPASPDLSPGTRPRDAFKGPRRNACLPGSGGIGPARILRLLPLGPQFLPAHLLNRPRQHLLLHAPEAVHEAPVAGPQAVLGAQAEPPRQLAEAEQKVPEL